jgi:hypothetical protein
MTVIHTCAGCSLDDTAEPEPIVFQVKPQGAPHNDSAFTCAKHLATVVAAYGRDGHPSLVTPIRLENE